MHVPATQRTRDELDQNDAFLRAFLGLVSTLPVLDRVLEHSSRPAAQPAPSDATTAALRDAVLGAIALRQQLGDLLEQLVAQEPLRSASTLPLDPEPLRELLR